MVVLWGTVALLLVSTAGWIASAVRRNANVVDQLWGVAQITLAATCLVAGDERAPRSWLCAALVTVWGLRLTIHLATRDRGRGEDFRHASARDRDPRFVWRSLPLTFWFQLVGGGLGVGLPMFAVVDGGQPDLGWLDAVGAAVWAAGLATEATADLQLARFRRTRTPGAVLDTGLWRYSRHPNYFGEVVVWTGVALLGVAAGAWWALVSPLVVLVVIVRVSGIAVMDEHLRATRGERYAEYVRTTSAFVPLPKRRNRLPST
jgi:steroid 5-alpha reductase family enzyme